MYIPAPTETKEFQSCPAGTHLGICTRVIDLGTHKKSFNGDEKTVHQLMLTWEVPDERMEDGRPFSISQFYTWSMHEKSTLRKHLESWRGATFDAKDFGEGGFDIKNILGKPCTLSVTHKEGREGKVFANVTGVGKMMKGLKAPPPVNELLYLWIHPDRWDDDIFAKLSQGVQKMIISSPEYARMKGTNGHDSSYDDIPEQTGSDHREPPRGIDLDDDIPF